MVNNSVQTQNAWVQGAVLHGLSRSASPQPATQQEVHRGGDSFPRKSQRYALRSQKMRRNIEFSFSSHATSIHGKPTVRFCFLHPSGYARLCFATRDFSSTMSPFPKGLGRKSSHISCQHIKTGTRGSTRPNQTWTILHRRRGSQAPFPTTRYRCLQEVKLLISLLQGNV